MTRIQHMQQVWLTTAALFATAMWWNRAAIAEDHAPDKVTRDTQGVEPGHESSTKPQIDNRLREGAEIRDTLGEFYEAGGRIIFRTVDKKITLQVLENLSLERVTRILEETPGQRAWMVTGTITEFREKNYLFVTRAILKARLSSERRPQVVQEKEREKQSPKENATGSSTDRKPPDARH